MKGSNILDAKFSTMKTHRFLLTAALVACCFIVSQAQSNYGEFKWGLTGGVSFASMNKANTQNELGSFEKDKGKVGLVGGAFCKIPLSHKASIRPELLFHMKGATLNFTNDIDLTVKDRFSLNYVELPLSLDFEFMGIIDLHAGVQGAFLLGKILKEDGERVDLPDDFYNKTEFGFHIGTGIDLGNIGLHVRFQQSLNSFLKKELSPDFNPRNWGITLTGAYMFIN